MDDFSFRRLREKETLKYSKEDVKRQQKELSKSVQSSTKTIYVRKFNSSRPDFQTDSPKKFSEYDDPLYLKAEFVKYQAEIQQLLFEIEPLREKFQKLLDQTQCRDYQPIIYHKQSPTEMDVHDLPLKYHVTAKEFYKLKQEHEKIKEEKNELRYIYSNHIVDRYQKSIQAAEQEVAFLNLKIKELQDAEESVRYSILDYKLSENYTKSQKRERKYKALKQKIQLEVQNHQILKNAYYELKENEGKATQEQMAKITRLEEKLTAKRLKLNKTKEKYIKIRNQQIAECKSIGEKIEIQTIEREKQNEIIGTQKEDFSSSFAEFTENEAKKLWAGYFKSHFTKKQIQKLFEGYGNLAKIEINFVDDYGYEAILDYSVLDWTLESIQEQFKDIKVVEYDKRPLNQINSKNGKIMEVVTIEPERIFSDSLRNLPSDIKIPDNINAPIFPKHEGHVDIDSLLNNSTSQSLLITASEPASEEDGNKEEFLQFFTEIGSKFGNPNAQLTKIGDKHQSDHDITKQAKIENNSLKHPTQINKTPKNKAKQTNHFNLSNLPINQTTEQNKQINQQFNQNNEQNNQINHINETNNKANNELNKDVDDERESRIDDNQIESETNSKETLGQLFTSIQHTLLTYNNSDKEEQNHNTKSAQNNAEQLSNQNEKDDSKLSSDQNSKLEIEKQNNESDNQIESKSKDNDSKEEKSSDQFNNIADNKNTETKQWSESNHSQANEITNPEIIPNEINSSQITENEITHPEIIPNEINSSQAIENEINHSQSDQNEMNSQQSNQNEINSSQAIENEINHSQSNQNEINHSQSNQNEMNSQQSNQNEINSSQAIENESNSPHSIQIDKQLSSNKENNEIQIEEEESAEDSISPASSELSLNSSRNQNQNFPSHMINLSKGKNLSSFSPLPENASSIHTPPIKLKVSRNNTETEKDDNDSSSVNFGDSSFDENDLLDLNETTISNEINQNLSDLNNKIESNKTFNNSKLINSNQSSSEIIQLNENDLIQSTKHSSELNDLDLNGLKQQSSNSHLSKNNSEHESSKTNQQELNESNKPDQDLSEKNISNHDSEEIKPSQNELTQNLNEINQQKENLANSTHENNLGSNQKEKSNQKSAHFLASLNLSQNEIIKEENKEINSSRIINLTDNSFNFNNTFHSDSQKHCFAFPKLQIKRKEEAMNFDTPPQKDMMNTSNQTTEINISIEHKSDENQSTQNDLNQSTENEINQFEQLQFNQSAENQSNDLTQSNLNETQINKLDNESTLSQQNENQFNERNANQSIEENNKINQFNPNKAKNLNQNENNEAVSNSIEVFSDSSEQNTNLHDDLLRPSSESLPIFEENENERKLERKQSPTNLLILAGASMLVQENNQTRLPTTEELSTMKLPIYQTNKPRYKFGPEIQTKSLDPILPIPNYQPNVDSPRRNKPNEKISNEENSDSSDWFKSDDE